MVRLGMTHDPAGDEAAEIAVLPSPMVPWKGAPLRVIVAAEKPLAGELALIAPDGSVAAKSRDRHGGPPYFWFAEVASPAAGTWRVNLARDHATSGCSTSAQPRVMTSRSSCSERVISPAASRTSLAARSARIPS